jgi:predicted deacetylase
MKLSVVEGFRNHFFAMPRFKPLSRFVLQFSGVALRIAREGNQAPSRAMPRKGVLAIGGGNRAQWWDMYLIPHSHGLHTLRFLKNTMLRD